MSVTNLAIKLGPPAAAGLEFPPKFSFEVSDLCYYLASGNTTTGIQRVQQELVDEFLRANTNHVTFIIYDRDLQKWRSVPSSWLLSLIEAARIYQAGGRTWAEIYYGFAAQIPTFPLKQFAANDWLFNVGASWALPGYFIQIRQLRRRGVGVAVFLHDCIPLRFPAYFDQFHTVEFTSWLAQMRSTADLVICNSQATKKDFLSIIGPLSAKVHVCPLAAGWRPTAPSTLSEIGASELLSNLGIDEQDFVLSVGTIEPRKNHLSLIQVWDRLRSSHRECPNLVCVGRIGWKSEPIIAQAKALGLLNTKIHFLSGVSDDILRELYSKCLFSVYVSFYEGWGLPISESLASGKVCIAGSNSSLKEAGGDFAVYIDERSETSIYDAVVDYIDFPDKLQKKNEKVSREFIPRSWTEVAQDLTAILHSEAASPRPAVGLSHFDVNNLYCFGRKLPITNFEQSDIAESFCVGHSWHRPEPWGMWTSKESSELALRLPTKRERPVIFIGIIAPPGAPAEISVSVNGKLVKVLSNVSGSRILRIPLEEERLAAGAVNYTPVRIRIASDRVQNMGEIAASGDTRQLGIGYRYMIGFDKESLYERLEYLESIITDAL